MVYFLFFYFLKYYFVCKLQNSRFFSLIIGNTKAQRAGLRFSREAREPHTLVGPVSLALFHLPAFRLTARPHVLNEGKK